MEPPIVPVTVKPVDEMKRKLFNVTFNVLTLPFTPSLQNISSPAYVSESAVIIDQVKKILFMIRIENITLHYTLHTKMKFLIFNS